MNTQGITFDFSRQAEHVHNILLNQVLNLLGNTYLLGDWQCSRMWGSEARTDDIGEQRLGCQANQARLFQINDKCYPLRSSNQELT